MNLADLVGTPVQDPPGEMATRIPACSEPAPPVPSSQLETNRTKRTWLVVAVAAAVALAALAGWVAARAVAVDQPATPMELAHPMPAEVAGAAEIFTARYLAGQTVGSDSLYAGQAPEPTGTWINHTAAIAGTTDGNGVWEVTVAVDSLEPVGGSFTPVELRYFAVPISNGEGGTFALAAPARVPGPGSPAEDGRFYLQVPPDQEATATRFLEEYLTAGPEIARYVAVANPIDTFVTSPYAEVEPTVLGADSLGRIKASVAATNERGITHRLEYILTVSLDSGVWVVADLAPTAG